MFFEMVQFLMVCSCLVLGFVSLRFAFWHAGFLQFIFTKLRLPFTIRVHRFTGLEVDEVYYNIYNDKQRDPYRFNVDVNVSGNIILYRGRF
jgi:hypothetical protein